MKCWELVKGVIGLQGLRQVERPDPVAGPGQVLVRMRAASLNYRDQAVLHGGYPGGMPTGDMIPLSDGAGEVIAVGEGVSRFKAGDRVAANFNQVDPKGPAGGPMLPLGAPLDGVLTEKAVFHESGLVMMPPAYSFEEAACMPCAGVTAWHGLMIAGKPIKPGDTVLTMGTGGVSLWALEIAKAAGCRVIATTSSAAKAAKLKAMGASDVINYKDDPDWDKAALALTGGKGVDAIVEVGGSGTLGRSINAVGPGGKIALIGVLTHYEGGKPAKIEQPSPHGLMFKGASLHGVFVGDRAMFEGLNRAAAVNGIKPVIDKVFAFDNAIDAYKHAMGGDFIGKIVVAI